MSTEVRSAETSAGSVPTAGKRRSGGLQAREAVFARLLMAPALIIVLVTVLVPLVLLVNLSFREVGLARVDQLSQLPFTLQNYATAVFDVRLLSNLWISIVYVVAVTGGGFLIGLGTALLLNQVFPLRQLFRTFILLPWAIPGVTATVAVMWILNPSYGVANYILRTLGLIEGDINWFFDPATALFAVSVPSIWKAYPFFTIMLLAGLQSVPRELYEAAAVDGAGSLGRFQYVTWPGIRSYAGLASAFTALYAFREFDFIYASTKGGPGGATETVAIRIYNEAFASFNLGRASAVGVATFVLVAAIVAVWLSRQRSTLLSSGGGPSA